MGTAWVSCSICQHNKKLTWWNFSKLAIHVMCHMLLFNFLFPCRVTVLTGPINFLFLCCITVLTGPISAFAASKQAATGACALYRGTESAYTCPLLSVQHPCT